MVTTSERDENGRRRLTERERGELLDMPVAGVYSTLMSDGRIHSVPVHFLPSGNELRILAERDSVKCRNSERAGRATLCVETTFRDTDRRYVSAEGPVSIESPVRAEDRVAIDRSYGREDPAEPDPITDDGSVMLVLRPEQWIAWSDAD